MNEWLGWLLKVIGDHPLLALLFVFAVDLPRDVAAMFSVGISRWVERWQGPGAKPASAYSIVIPVLNDAGDLLRTLQALRQQTLAPAQIIVVNDGSNDMTAAVLQHAMDHGLVHLVLHNDVRMGVAGSCNKALHFVQTPCVMFLDADTQLAPDACEHLLQRLAHKGLAAVSGNIGIRNASASLWTGLQQIEYWLAIDFGRTFLDKFNAIGCLSGAMTLFDVQALRAIGGYAQGSGQDLEVTLRLRRQGYRIGFASRAWAYTRAPATATELAAQRLRWDSDAMRIHIYQHHQWRPASGREPLGNTLQRLDFIHFNLLPTLLLPALPIGLWAMAPDDAWLSLLAAYLMMLGIQTVNLAVVFAGTRARVGGFSLLLVPLMPLYLGFYLKVVRFYAYLAETLWHVSSATPFLPTRVRKLLQKEL